MRIRIHTVLQIIYKKESNGAQLKTYGIIKKWLLKGLSHEIDLKSFDKNLQNLA